MHARKKKQSISPNANGFLPAPYVVVLSSNWYIYIVRATNYESIAWRIKTSLMVWIGRPNTEIMVLVHTLPVHVLLCFSLFLSVCTCCDTCAPLLFSFCTCYDTTRAHLYACLQLVSFSSTCVHPSPLRACVLACAVTSLSFSSSFGFFSFVYLHTFIVNLISNYFIDNFFSAWKFFFSFDY